MLRTTSRAAALPCSNLFVSKKKPNQTKPTAMVRHESSERVLMAAVVAPVMVVIDRLKDERTNDVKDGVAIGRQQLGLKERLISTQAEPRMAHENFTSGSKACLASRSWLVTCPIPLIAWR